MQRVASELGRQSVTRNEQDERGRFNSSTLHRRFGSWFVALERAGLQPTRSPINIPNEYLFKNLEEVWTRLGKQPAPNDLLAAGSRYGKTTYIRRFNTWRKALEAFVQFVNLEATASSEQTIETQVADSTTKHKTSRAINWRLRFVVMRRDSYRCKSCGRSPATDLSTILHVDHVLAWVKGGETVLENLQTLCLVCNIGKSDLDYMNGA